MSGDARIVSAYLSGPIQREKFPRSARLLRHADFEQVYKRGKRHFSALMTVFFLAREQNGGMRVGFTVGKVLGGAVVRNRMKRRLRELARAVLPEAGIAGADHVLIGRAGGVERPYAELVEDFTKALRKVQKGPSTGSGRTDRGSAP